MKLSKVIDARLEALLAGDPATEDPLDGELSTLITQINELVPEPVISPAIAEAHLAKIVDAAGSLVPRPLRAPAEKKRSGWMERLSLVSASPSRKIAAATLSVSAAFSGLAYAGALPDPIQRAAANIASFIGVSIPDPGVVTSDSDVQNDTDETEPGDAGDGRQDGDHRQDGTHRPTDNPTQPEKPAKPAKPEKPEKLTKPETPDKEKPAHPTKPETPGNSGKTKAEKPTKPEKPEKPDKPGKPDEPGKPDKPDKEKPEERPILDDVDLDGVTPPTMTRGGVL